MPTKQKKIEPKKARREQELQQKKEIDSATIKAKEHSASEKKQAKAAKRKAREAKKEAREAKKEARQEKQFGNNDRNEQGGAGGVKQLEIVDQQALPPQKKIHSLQKSFYNKKKDLHQMNYYLKQLLYQAILWMHSSRRKN